MNPTVPAHDPFPALVVTLMKGVLWRQEDEKKWHQLRTLEGRVRDYMSVMGLSLELDENEGFALLRQRNDDDSAELPRLIPRRPLGYHVSLLLVLLRKRLLEVDAGSGNGRLVLKRDELIDLLRQFCGETTNEVRLHEQLSGTINKVRDLGFLRQLRDRDAEFEVVRLIKTLIDADHLEQLLGDLRQHSSGQDKESLS